jgi:hypothetical protein
MRREAGFRGVVAGVLCFLGGAFWVGVGREAPAVARASPPLAAVVIPPECPCAEPLLALDARLAALEARQGTLEARVAGSPPVRFFRVGGLAGEYPVLHIVVEPGGPATGPFARVGRLPAGRPPVHLILAPAGEDLPGLPPPIVVPWPRVGTPR